MASGLLRWLGQAACSTAGAETGQSQGQMSPDPGSEPRWTLDDLLAAAAGEEFPATRRLVRNWIEEGLLDRAHIRGHGPSQGVEGLWSGHQQALFLALLASASRQPTRRNAPLANLPVWVWLAYGDAYVPLRQVRRALRTWTVPARHPAESSAVSTARSVVASLAHPAAAATARRRFRALLARGQAGEDVAHAELVAAARPVIDPFDTGVPRGPAGAAISPQIYGGYVEWMVAGADAVLRDRGGELLPDFVLRRARAIYRESRADYAARRPGFARDPDLGHLHSDPTLDAVVPTACHDLVMCLGMILATTDWRRRHKRRTRS